MNGRGYGGNVGPGNGGETSISPISGGGAGYGGNGGMSSSNALGGTGYGSLTQPVDLGSGGGYGAAGSGAVGGSGGGAVKIVASGDLILDGLISANGADATNSRSGGGSGGSIWLSARTITGAGVLAANGGVGDPPVTCSGSAWQNGSLNQNQAHYLGSVARFARGTVVVRKGVSGAR